MSDEKRVYESPTFEQIVCFAAVHLYGPAGLFRAQMDKTQQLLEADADFRKEWYRRHYETQRDVWQRADAERKANL